MSERSESQEVASAIYSLKDDLLVNLCAEIEETRERVEGVRRSVADLLAPAYIIAISLAVIANSVFAGR
ncbi:hypothetical protein [Erythrobacter sp.]|uniref:hypothetical protein n=1 Tax=Erythrobacter sp. TaxID=1042 RepID=UPI001425F0B1|nr:hypothetical protein [Erythrobacter sp.]QIQ87404.1 MAG: hypothetical protein G9473_12445 [Erythrobacter sp.]